MSKLSKDSFDGHNNNPFIHALNRLVLVSIKVLAILMVLVIWLSLADVVVHLYNQFSQSFVAVFDVENLLGILGNILAVLIAIEIFLNIIFYLTKDSINVSLVLATALTAVARKIIILDYKAADFFYVLALAAIILSLGISFFLAKKNGTPN